MEKGCFGFQWAPICKHELKELTKLQQAALLYDGIQEIHPIPGSEKSNTHQPIRLTDGTEKLRDPFLYLSLGRLHFVPVAGDFQKRVADLESLRCATR
jgi:hypothetical protein